jgi:hypothetical protein
MNFCLASKDNETDTTSLSVWLKDFFRSSSDFAAKGYIIEQ